MTWTQQDRTDFINAQHLVRDASRHVDWFVENEHPDGHQGWLVLHAASTLLRRVGDAMDRWNERGDI